MTEFIPIRTRRAERTGVLITASYAVLALVLGIWGNRISVELLRGALSPMSPSSAVAVLSAEASGMLAFIGIVFSLLFIFLQFGSSAYSPRLAREFSRQRLTPHSLGIFIGTVAYALLAIRAVDLHGIPGVEAPVVAVAWLWLLASLTMLILILPRIGGLTIQRVLHQLGERGAAAARRRFPAPALEGEPRRWEAPRDLAVTQEIRHIGSPLYVVGFDLGALVSAADAAGGVVVVEAAVGDPVVEGDRLAVVLGGRNRVSGSRLRDAVWLRPSREVDNDPAYALRLLADVAIRALSPSVNDPTTAVNAIDQIEWILRTLGRSQLDSGEIVDGSGELRVVYPVPGWDDLVTLALAETQQYGATSLQVERRLGALLRDLRAILPRSRQRALDRLADRRRQALRDDWEHEEERGAASANDRQGLGRTTEPLSAPA